ncbi:hypothetical protein [Kitasatospora griseola]|uniref:hypothetical protein n=1 Tax=Kitasatospora griseola TaxID=2064 RepID=UPI00167153B9|nr:hypothetical protein [Kitasatospora griseola]
MVEIHLFDGPLDQGRPEIGHSLPGQEAHQCADPYVSSMLMPATHHRTKDLTAAVSPAKWSASRTSTCAS